MLFIVESSGATLDNMQPPLLLFMLLATEVKFTVLLILNQNSKYTYRILYGSVQGRMWVPIQCVKSSYIDFEYIQLNISVIENLVVSTCDSGRKF